jgi:lipopolysaccharide/colanic/teichoic acid biosynthesis glycosyltransferase
MVVSYIISSIDTQKNGVFMQTRIGRYGKPFKVIKLRTMKDSGETHTTVTNSNDPRITGFGKFFRKTKIDELPQLINVLIGQMSLVGPRPDVPGFADLLQGDDRLVLSIRPGITGPASLYFKKEEELLATVDNPEEYNKEVLFPKKVLINLEYIRNYSVFMDLRYILGTVIPPFAPSCKIGE